jgi:hypothetical protein
MPAIVFSEERRVMLKVEMNNPMRLQKLLLIEMGGLNYHLLMLMLVVQFQECH